jgi:protein involved in polysaccharide export with SLBB domain
MAFAGRVFMTGSCFRVNFRVALLLCAALVPTARVQQQPTPPKPHDYRIGPGDILQLTVTKHPELSVESIEVRPAGYISLLFHEEGTTGLATHDVLAAGLSAKELNRALSRRL